MITFRDGRKYLRACTAAFCLLAASWLGEPAFAQATPPPESARGFIDTGDARLYYLDHGGSGLPVIFTGQGGSDFAPDLTDRHRVVTITMHRVADATASGTERVPARARDLLGLLDAFGFERAVLVGRSYPQEMTYLAEHHPERLAGLVYAGGVPEVVDFQDLDPTGGYQLLLRAIPREVEVDVLGSLEYRPGYLDSPASMIEVPALVFGPDGDSAEPPNLMLTFGAQIANAPFFTDEEARAYFERLAGDEELRERVDAFHAGVVTPRVMAQRDAFRRAFRGNLVEVAAAPGPEGRETVADHLERFLEHVRGGSR